MDYESARGTENAVKSGRCGVDLKWRLEGNTLHIEGTGDMLYCPWESYKNEIEHVVISPGCTSIDSHAFWYYSVLKTIQLPNTLRAIGRYAFADCGCLEEVLLPDSVVDVGQSLFRGCYNLRYVRLSAQLRVIPKCTFNGCSSLPNIVIPEGVTGIGERAFRACTRLNSVTIPESVTRIGKDAFRGCHNLTNITIPGGVRTIGVGAFSFCWSGISILIPDSVPKVGAFSSSTFTMYNNAKETWWSQDWVSNRTDGGVVIGETEVCWTVGKTKVNTPISEMKIIEKYSGLTNVTILDGVAEIGEHSFMGNSDLTSITIPESVTKIDRGAFAWCRSLTNVTIPGSVIDIGENAFSDVTHIVYHGPAQSDNNWGALSRN